MGLVIDFETQKGKFTFVKLPANTKNRIDLSLNTVMFKSIVNDGNYYLYHYDNNKVSIIGFADDLTEKQWSEIVDKSENYNYSFNDYMWKDYIDITGWRGFKTATGSGKSLMESLEVHTENPLSENRPIPKEDLDFKHDKIREFERLRMRWLKKQQRTGNWLLIKYT